MRAFLLRICVLMGLVVVIPACKPPSSSDRSISQLGSPQNVPAGRHTAQRTPETVTGETATGETATGEDAEDRGRGAAPDQRYHQRLNNDEDLYPGYSAFDHGKECFEQLGGAFPPQIDCSKGALLPSFDGGIPNYSTLNMRHCDDLRLASPSWGCSPGGRLWTEVVQGTKGRIVNAAFCMRNQGFMVDNHLKDPVNPQDPWTQNIALESVNLESGKVCFFQIRKHEAGTRDPVVAPYSREYAKYDAARLSKVKALVNETYVPPGAITQAQACVRCHDGQPFIRSQFIARLRHLDPQQIETYYAPIFGGQNLNAEYRHVVGSKAAPGASREQMLKQLIASYIANIDRLDLGLEAPRLSHVGKPFEEQWGIPTWQPFRLQITDDAQKLAAAFGEDGARLLKLIELQGAEARETGFCTSCHAIGKSPINKETSPSGSCNHFTRQWTHHERLNHWFGEQAPSFRSPNLIKWLNPTRFEDPRHFYWMPPNSGIHSAEEWWGQLSVPIAALRLCCENPLAQYQNRYVCVDNADEQSIKRPPGPPAVQY